MREQAKRNGRRARLAHNARGFSPRVALFTCFAAGLPAAPPPQTDAFEQADRRYQQAFYELAIESYEKAVGGNPDPAVLLRADVGVARCLLALGRPAEALTRLSAEPPAGPPPPHADADAHADRLTVRGAALAAVGQYDAALAEFRAALTLRPGRAEPAARAAEILADLGRRDDALRLLAPYAAAKPTNLPDDAAERTWLARAMLAAAALQPDEDTPQRVRTVLHRVLQPMFDSRHRDRWLPRLAAAELLADKHNLSEAQADFEALLRLNPRVADAYVGLARVAARRGETAAADQHLLKALTLNPAHAPALRTLAELRLGDGQPQEALAAADKLLAVNPCDLEALALASAACTALGRDDDARGYVERAAAVNPRSPAVESTLGRARLAARRLDEAQRHFEAAVEYDPVQPRHRIDLGDLLMLRGDEAAAGETLRAARRLDPYNQRLINLVNLLADIERLATHETEHFVIRYDPRETLIPRFVPDVLENAHAELTARFEFEPPRRTLVEVFPTHGQFSTRISGRPWVATVGASTGPVIAVVSPAARRPSAYPWAACLRHEYSHTLTIGKSAGRISRWLTEGLAESLPGTTVEWEQRVALADLVRTNQLAPPHEIDRRFFGHAAAVQQAYAQARVMAQFLTEKWGASAVNRLLRACAETPTESAAMRAALQIDADEFYADFRAWLMRQLDAWGFPRQPHPDPKALSDRIAADPRDADALGMLADTRRVAGDETDAARLAAAALEIDERQVDALRTLALLPPSLVGPPTQESEQDQVTRLVERVDALLELAPDDPVILVMAADLAARLQRSADAVELFHRALARSPDCTPAHAALARMFLASGDTEGAYPHLVAWTHGEAGSIEPLLSLAEIARSTGNLQRATECVRRALAIDLFNPDLHRRLGALLTERNESAEAIERLLYAAQSLQTDESIWADLATNYAALGRRAEAVAAAEKAISLNADSRAQAILEALGGGAP